MEQPDILESILNRQGNLRSRQSRPTVQPGTAPGLFADQLPTDTPQIGQSVPFVPEIPRRVKHDIPERVGEIKIRPEDRRILKTMIYNMKEDLPTLLIEDSYISTYSSKEIEETSVAEVSRADRDALDPEKYNTVNDPRMGSVKYDIVCPTCDMDYSTCPGHHGHISLVVPIYHPLYFDDVLKILRSVCNSCGGLFFTKEEIEQNTHKFMSLSGKDRLKMIEKLSEKKQCIRNQISPDQFIGTACTPQPKEITSTIGPLIPCLPNPKYLTRQSKMNEQIVYRCTYGDDVEMEHVRTIEEVYKILNRIDDEMAKVLGFSGGAHPRNFIIRTVLVIPPCSRPSAIRDGEETPHPITDTYKNIVRYNISSGTEKDPVKKAGARRKLQEEYRKLILGTDGQSTRGIPYKSVTDLIQSKEGLVRNNMMGKRVDYTARTVIGPGPTLRFGQVGIPEEIARFLTIPEIVSLSNRDHLQSLIERGQITRIKIGSGNKKGQTINLSSGYPRNLRPGDIVSRWLQDGDYIILNRQPTLHKQGMMGAEVKIMKGLTIRLHMSYTSAYNADFDGDEMNLHIPQTIEALNEVQNLMNVKNCIMNAQTNAPSMALVFDSLLGVYLMTQPDTLIDEDTWVDSLMIMTSQDQLVTLDDRLKKHNVAKFIGRALFSSLLPDDFYYTSREDKNSVIIIDGVLISGIISKKHVGISSVSIIIELFKRYGRNRAAGFLTDAPWVINKYLLQRGFSVGLKDCYPIAPELHDKLRTEVAEVREFAETMKINMQDPNEDKKQEDTIVARLNRARDIGNRMVKTIPPDNNLRIMALSGAKGNELNIAQISIALGPQFLFGERFKQSLSGGTRCLPYFKEGDVDPAGRGFCLNSFSTGLSPAELFFHQSGGREGMIDTAIKTAEVGDLHRKMTKMLEDLIVNFDGSVRNANGDIIQFAYGEDGLDASHLQFVKIGTERIPSFINMSQIVGQINASYGY